MVNRQLTSEYIRGLIEGGGTFTFTTSTSGHKKIRVPAFQLRMHVGDRKLIEAVRDYLCLKNKVYAYHYPGKDGAKRGPQAVLIVREIGNLKNIVIPFFYGKLAGNKGIQFNDWLEKIGSDPTVSGGFKILYRLHKSGFYLRENKFPL